MSLLIIRCPLKPFTGSNATAPSDLQGESCVEQFEWCLVEEGQATEFTTGIGSTQSMPYADEALVLMPTLDVRLIEAKVPLANAKKLQQILPNLIEDFVLTGVESLTVEALPPIPDSPVLQRTIALIDRNWYRWLNKQLERLLAPRVRLVPECLMLSLASEGAPELLAYCRTDNQIVFTRRTSIQLGASWVEQIDSTTTVDEIPLPQSLSDSVLTEISWSWLAGAAQEYVLANSNSRSANFALNLLPNHFRRDAASGLAGNKVMSVMSRLLQGRSNKASSGGMNLSWTDPLVWRRPLNWAGYCTVSLILGFAAYASWLTLDDWRFTKRMELLAARNLSPSSIALLNQNKSADSPPAVLNAFMKQVTAEQRRHGGISDADFGAMVAKLQQFKAPYGPEVLQKIDYDGYAIIFEFKLGALTTSSKEVLARARSLGLAVTLLGPNRYRLEPYAGLGSN